MFKIKMNDLTGVTTYKTEDEANKIAKYLKKIFPDLIIEVIPHD